ncbi:MAG: TonB-dependent receptor, partial [Alphaproteobacteria bacterium]|nr:TonB-dependent receptor [Alphaproteobacteria bacterium]
ISLTALETATIDNLKASGADVRFLSARVPSVIAESSFGRAFPRFYIRGIGNTDFDLNASQPVSLVYDGVPYESPILKGYPAFDLQAIEVLRGPQGTLFGRNSPGGIIKFDSKKPTDEFDAYARAAWGTYNTIDLEGAVGGRLTDALAVRVSGLAQTRDDYVDNGFTGEDDAYEGFEEYAGRVQLMFTPFENDFSALLNLHGRSNDSSARLFRANIISQGARGLNENFDRDTVFYDGGGGNPLDQEAWGATLTIEKSLSDSVALTYIYGYETAEVFSRGDIDGGFGAVFLGEGNFGPGLIPFPSESAGGVDDLTQVSHELRAAFDNGGPLRGQAGIFIFDEDVEITSLSFDTLSDTPDTPNGIARRRQDTQAFGIFASLSYDMSEKLTVSGGARLSDDEKDFVAERTCCPFGSGTVGPLTETVADDQVSWDVSASYDASEAINLYGRIARGFRSPSVQGRIVFGNELSSADSETVLSYEAGVKSQLWQNRVRANANVFYYELNDQQLTIVGGLDNTVALFNADEGEGYGFETDIEALITPQLRVTGGLSYNHTQIKDDLLVAPGCGAPCTILDPEVLDADGNLLGYNISGNSFPNAPEWIANVTARYAVPFRNGEFYAFTDWAYKGETNFFLYESVEFGQDGYWEGGLRLGYAAEAGYDVSLFARNILDEEALTGGIDFNNLTGFVNEPFTAGVELGWQY